MPVLVNSSLVLKMDKNYTKTIHIMLSFRCLVFLVTLHVLLLCLVTIPNDSLTLIRGFLGGSFLVGGTHTHTCIFKKYIFYYQGHLNFGGVIIYLQKSAFLGKSSTFTQSNSMRAVLEIVSFCF